MVNSKVLCQKLKIYGLDNHSINWIKSYTEDRFQAVWIDHILSDWIKVEVGVPQGIGLDTCTFLRDDLLEPVVFLVQIIDKLLI